MKYIVKVIKLSVFAVMVFIMTGCAVFPGGEIPQVDLVELVKNIESKPSLSYEFNARGGLSSTKDLPDDVESIIEIELLDVLNKSEYFREVIEGDVRKDIHLNITITNSGNPAAMIPAFITGFSLYSIPSWATDKFEVKAKVAKSDGMEREYVLNDTATLVQWFPMILAFPSNSMSVIKDVRSNMYRAVLLKMNEDGFF